MLVLRLVWAAHIPLGNDEAYYWDWARHLQMSYLDHPPGVAWVAYIGLHLAAWLGVSASSPLAPRLLLPFIHLAATLVLLRCLLILEPKAKVREAWLLVLLVQWVPAFSLGGFFLVPDCGLLLGMALALWALLAALRGPMTRALPWWRGIAFGAALGLAGLFKYHAAPLAAGLTLGALVCRHRWRDLGFWLCAVVSGALLFTPVWLWNSRHAFASFRFQGQHGFSQLHLSLLTACQLAVGVTAFLTPALVWGLLRYATKTLTNFRRQPTLAVVPAFGFLPLFALIGALSFWKQMLPHWILPAFWLLLPGFAMELGGLWERQRRWWLGNAVFGAGLILVATTILGSKPLRQRLVDSFHGRPGPLGELTFWDALVRDAAKTKQTWLTPSAPIGCPPILASLKWFWNAQMAFHLPGQPRVYSLDLEHPSYYLFRDDMRVLAGCPVTIVGDARHFNRSVLEPVVAIEQVERFSVSDHRDVPVLIVRGRMRTVGAIVKAYSSPSENHEASFDTCRWSSPTCS